MRTGDMLISSNEKYKVVMQNDGNLASYTTNDKYLWDAVTGGNSGAKITLQSDGNLVIYSATGNALWSSQTHPHFDPFFRNTNNKPVKLVMENDGQIALYNSANKVVWTNKTGVIKTKSVSNPTKGSGNSSFNLEYVSGGNQSYGGGGMPSAMVFKVKEMSGSYVTDLRAKGLAFEVKANKGGGKLDGNFNNWNNYCKNGDKSCYGGYYYIPSNRGGTSYVLELEVTLKKGDTVVDTYTVKQNIK
jgi:hypothetical protein